MSKPSLEEIFSSQPTTESNSDVKPSLDEIFSGNETAKKALKSIYPDTSNIEKSNPYVSAIAKTGREAVNLPAHFFNQMAFNQPRAITEKMGYEYPSKVDTNTTSGKVSDIGARILGVAGMIKSPIGKGIEKLVPGATVKAAAMRGVLTGLAYSPEDPTDVKQRVIQGTIGAGLGAASQKLGNIVFKRQIASKELTEGAGARLQQAEIEMQKAFEADPIKHGVDPKPILDQIKPEFDKIADKKGTAGSALRTWIQILEKKVEGGEKLSPTDLLEARQRLGSAANFAKEKGGALVRTEINNEATGKLAKEATRTFSSKIKEVASNLGIDNFEKDSATVSKILKNYSDLDPSKGRGDFFERGYISTALGMALKNPALAGVAYELLKIADSPEGKNNLFKFLQSTTGKATKRVARVGIQQGVNLVKGNQ